MSTTATIWDEFVLNYKLSLHQNKFKHRKQTTFAEWAAQSQAVLSSRYSTMV